ncbi:MAG: DUF1732 domain-containing protein, partial [Deltaproteobacteria bacterium]|nr:DUF1732 domain-containing protein [Deltaproteobacteria bacterium]
LESAVDVEAEWDALKSGVRSAFDGVIEWREKEGRALKQDMEERLKNLLRMTAQIEERAPDTIARYRERLKEKIRLLCNGDGLDESRLITEVAIMAERCAFDEEVVRLKSHATRFNEYLESKEPVGRKLDFLCQELLRETNTVASKSYDTDITHTVVEMKSELEKIREQAQNIE